MRKSGLYLILIGLLLALFAGYQFMTREKVVEIGELQITQNQTHTANWSPLIGIGLMVIGSLLVILSSRK